MSGTGEGGAQAGRGSAPPQRSAAQAALAAFCVATLLFIVPRDLFVAHVRDVEVWGGLEVHGPVAWATAPIHWAVFAVGAWAAWRARPWALPAAAGYAFYVALSHVVWNLVSEGGGGLASGLAQGAIFSVPGAVLLLAHRRGGEARRRRRGATRASGGRPVAVGSRAAGRASFERR